MLRGFFMDSTRPILLLLILGAIMFLLRTFSIYPLIFTDWNSFVNFASDDAVYHMRLVHNTIHHFPRRIFFDPFTHFPFGNLIHFGPLFTLIISGTSLLVGLGDPSPELINLIGAFTPVIMGVLCLVPLYFIACNLFGKTGGLVATFILAFLPGEFLNRSALGFTDHHIAETLFSTTTCLFLIYALNSAKNWQQNLRSLLRYGILSGISFGLFILIWPAALLFGAIFLMFFITQLIVDHLKNKQTGYLLLLAVIIYTIPTVMVLPYSLMNPHLDTAYYSLTQPIMLVAMVSTFATSYLIHIVCKLNRLTKDLYTPILLIVFVLAVFILQLYNPEFFSLITDGIRLLFEPTIGMRNIVEVHPSILNESGTSFSAIPIWRNYYWMALFAIIGFGYLSYRVYQKTRPKEIFLLIWSITTMFAVFAQSRFNYYFAINVAILAGCYSIYPLLNFLNRSKQKIALYTAISIFAILNISPILMLVIDKSAPKPLSITRERYDTLIWLKTNTPDPQGKIINKEFDYASGYFSLPKNPDAFYQYPKSAYGIMAWWNIGHQITYIAERIPNTNPFQRGIIEKDRSMGAASFFTSKNEKKAVQNLNRTGSRYVLITNRIANHIKGIDSWNNDPEYHPRQ